MFSAVAGVPGASIRVRARLSVDAAHFVLCGMEIANHLDTSDDAADPPDAPMTVRLWPSRVARLRADGTAFPIGSPETTTEPNPIASMIRSADDGILVSNRSGLEFVSQSCAELLNRSREELVERYGDFFHPDDQAELVAYIDRLSHSPGRPVHATVRVAMSGEPWGTFTLDTNNLIDDADFVSFITIVRRAEDSPAIPGDTEAQIREALSQAADPVVTLSSDGHIHFASSSAAEIFQVPVSAVMSRALTDFVASSSKATAQAWLDSDDSHDAAKIALQRPDGSQRWVMVRLLFDRLPNPLDDRIVVIQDIHLQVLAEQALQAREERFETLVRNAPGCAVVLTPGDVISFASRSIERTLGLRSDLVAGMRFDARIHPEDLAAMYAALTRAKQTRGVVSLTCRLRTGAGSWRWFGATLQDHDEPTIAQGVVVNLLDRTDEVLAEAALHESERRFRALVQHSFEVTIIIDEHVKVIWISPSVEDLFGWRPDEVIGRAGFAFVHPEDADLVTANLRAAIDGIVPRPFTTIRLKTRAGGWRHVMASVADRRDDPDIGGLIVNLRDATDQVASKAALQASESRYRTLIQNSTDVVQIMTASARVIWVSPAVENVLGYPPEDLYNEPTGALTGLAGRETLVKSFLEVLHSPGATSRCVARVQHRDGSWRWIDVVIVNRLHQPEIQGIVATYRDITERIEIEQARRASEERFRSLAESSPLGIFQLDLDQRCIYVNERWCEITGQSADESMGDGWRSTIRRGNNKLGEPSSDIDHFYMTEPGIRLIRSNGDARWCAVHFAPLTDDNGERTGSVGTIDDVTTTVDVRQEAGRLSTILETTPDLVLLFKPDGTLVYLNGAAAKFFELEDAHGLLPSGIAELLPPDNIRLWNSEILPTLQSGRPWQGETTVRNRSDNVIPISAVVIGHLDGAGTIEMVSITARDMSDRKALEARLQFQANHDPLTGLPNRTLLLDRLEVAMKRSDRTNNLLAVIFLDLDHFKVVNDSLGHGTGDGLLTVLADRLHTMVRPGDTVARFGGDEFVIVCEDLESRVVAEEIAGRIGAAMAEPAWIGGSEVFVTASLGVALVDHLHQNPDQVLRDADAAMYQAKARGRARFEVFDPRFRTKALDRLSVENALRRALARDELVVHYQPVFDLVSRAVVGVEALVRWEHPQRALLLPSEFLAVAEESGLIVPIGEWVLRQACVQMNGLAAELPEGTPLRVAVNLSARQIVNPYLVEQITEILDETHMDPANLTLEITESILMDDVIQSNETLGRLKGLGIGLAIDDFGTGYSSFAYLQKFPVDVLKVDRSFVSGLGNEPGDAAITEAIVSLSHTLGLVAVAEGVESEDQLDALIRVGCDHAQGFLLSRPLEFSRLKAFLDSRHFRNKRNRHTATTDDQDPNRSLQA